MGPSRKPEPIQRKPVPPPRPIRPSAPKPTPSPKRPDGPPSKLPVFSFFPQLGQQGNDNVQEFPRSNPAPPPQINSVTKLNNKSRKTISSSSKQRGTTAPRPQIKRPQPKDIKTKDTNNNVRVSNQLKPRPRPTEPSPPPRPQPTRAPSN